MGTTSSRRRSSFARRAWWRAASCRRGCPRRCEEHIGRTEAEQRPGITGLEARERPRAAVDRAAADLQSFRDRNGLDSVVVLNVSSTEAPVDPHPAHADADELLDAVDRGLGVLPPSSLYALAAIETGCAFIDFTPSTGARLPALEALAEHHDVPLAGRDGKTGETFVKTALAPAFAARALHVHSWAGMNLLGGGDGMTLADPDRARSKLTSKARCLEEILGYPLETPVRIDQVADLGEWKTAWDHITFEGFLGVRMKMQFVWEGCDSALAAPLLIDLARFGALALERGDARRGLRARVLLQGPGGHERARARPAVRDAPALGAPGGSAREARRHPGRWRSSSACPRCSSVPGDVLVGAAAAGRARDLRRSAGLAGASSCLYLAGMALNDYADREVDARERPSRPIPSGRVTPGFALGLAAGLTASGAALAVAADGPRALALVLPLAGAVWSYDLVLKNTAAGPGGMSACRTLDVLLGAGLRGVPRALPAAAVVGAHTAIVTTVSRREVEGGTATPGHRRARGDHGTRRRGCGRSPGDPLDGTARGRARPARCVRRGRRTRVRRGPPRSLAGADAAGRRRRDPRPDAARVGAARRGGRARSRLRGRGALARRPLALAPPLDHVSFRYAYVTNGLTGHRLEDAVRLLADCGYGGIALTLDHVHLDPFATDVRARAARVRPPARRQRAHVRGRDRRALRARPASQAPPDAALARPGRRASTFSAARSTSPPSWAPRSSRSGRAPRPESLEPGRSRGSASSPAASACWSTRSAARVTIGFEPEPGMLVERLDDYETLADRLGHPPRLGLTLDLGHCVCLEPEPVAACIRAARPTSSTCTSRTCGAASTST